MHYMHTFLAPAWLACAFLARVLLIARPSLDGVLSKTVPASLRSYKWGSYKTILTVHGEGHFCFHPGDLMPLKELLPLSRFGTDDDKLQHVQRKLSSVVHQSDWLKLLQRLRSLPGCGKREAARFIAVSQPHAGDYLNAVPKHAAFRMPTWALRIVVQRWLGLPLLAAAAASGGKSGRHGQALDSYGDVATNDNVEGHATRHFLILQALHDALRRVYGGQVQREPSNYSGYSDHRPDLTLLLDGMLTAFDLKVFDPLGSDPSKVEERAGYVAFGATLERAQTVVLGRSERGHEGDGAFNRLTGEGRVQAVPGDYARAQEVGVRCVPLLIETFGGWAPELVEVLQVAATWRSNKLAGSEYDETTWSARTWLTFAAQRISVATQLSAAQEVAQALGLSVAADPRAR